MFKITEAAIDQSIQSYYRNLITVFQIIFKSETTLNNNFDKNFNNNNNNKKKKKNTKGKIQICGDKFLWISCKNTKSLKVKPSEN